MKSQVRIIAGRWRGRKLTVIDAEGLRPTADRIRETLFSWLDSYCREAVVLDCFAGSGVLGWEAISRGASQLVAIEQRADAVVSLRRDLQRFDTESIEIIQGDSLQVIDNLNQAFDLVFVDPPYARPDLRAAVIQRLEAGSRLRPGAVIYFEWPAVESFDLPSPRLKWLKHKKAGKVNYAIAEWQSSR